MEIVKLLIEKGADIHEKNDNFFGGRTPLLYASEGRNTEIVKFLMMNGADKDVNVKGTNGDSPLLVAAAKGNFEMVKLLIANKANVNSKAENGRTPLHHASAHGSLEIVKYLISKGANKKMKTNDGKTPLDWAKERNHSEDIRIEKFFSNPKLISSEQFVELDELVALSPRFNFGHRQKVGKIGSFFEKDQGKIKFESAFTMYKDICEQLETV